MDWKEDLSLLEDFNLISNQIQEKEDEISKLKKELEEKNNFISEQSTIIQKYRTTLKTFQTRKRILKPVELDSVESKPNLKSMRLNEIIEQSQIKYPTAADSTYKELAIGQTIWWTIIRCFKKNLGGLISESMIMSETGKHVLFKQKEPFIDKNMIHRFFSHPFSFDVNDKTIQVRQLLCNKQQSWLVMMPEWLRVEIEHENKQDAT